MSSSGDKRWIVCKFGGTSVSSRDTWSVIVDHVRKLTGQGYKVCVVVSAVSQVTNHLEKVVDGLAREIASGAADAGLGLASASSSSSSPLRSIASGVGLADLVSAEPVGESAAAMQWVLERHQRICSELEVDESVPRPYLVELKRLVEGMRLTGDAASARLRARVLSFGELMSSHIGEKVLSRELSGLSVGLVDARQVLVSTSDREQSSGNGEAAVRSPADTFLNAEVAPCSLDLELAERLAERLTEACELESSGSLASGSPDPRASAFLGRDVVITQGFIAATPEGLPCVLGRGGSDTSGALFAALLSAKRLEIWTDVDGMYSSDPRHVPKARLIEELSYREAQELAAMGAKVLHPRCLGPASWAACPVEIHNTFGKHQEKLTRIMAPSALANGGMESTVMAIARRTGQVLLTIATVDMWGESGFLSRVFAPFARLDISVDLIATSQYAVSMTLDYIPEGINGDPFKMLLRALRRQGTVHVETDCTVVSIVGRKLRQVLHGMADAFKELERYNLLLLSESTEDLNMSFVLGESDSSVDELVLSLHRVLLERPLPGTAEHAALHHAPAAEAVAAAAVDEAEDVGGCPGSPRRKFRGASFSSANMLPARAVTRSAVSRENLLDPAVWVHEELAKYEHMATPFAIVDLASLATRARKLAVFSLRWSAHAAVLRTVFAANPKVVFLCRTPKQVLELCSVVGPSPRVYVPQGAAAAEAGDAASVATEGSRAAAQLGLPPSVKLEAEMPAEEEVAKAAQVLGDARVVVASVIDFADGEEAVVVDTWFQAKPAHHITLLSELPPSVRKVRALSLHEDMMDTLFMMDAPAAKQQEAAVRSPAKPTRVLLCGVATTPYSTSTQRPVQEYIRYSEA